jgi:lysophospholipase L1-like esterase
VFRIVVLGDSFMEAYQVPLETSLPYLLQERLADRKVEVINLGIGGYGTAQELLYLRDEGFKYQPDLVVLAFYPGNDVQNNSHRLQALLLGDDDLKVFGRPYASAQDLESEIEWSMPDAERVRPAAEKWRRKRTGTWNRIVRFLQPAMVANAVEQATATLAQRFAGRVAYDPNVMYGRSFLTEFAPEYSAPGLSPERYGEIWDQAWLSTRRVIREIDRQSAARGARFMLMIVPTLFQVDRESLDQIAAHYPGLALDETRINRDLRRFCEARGIDLLDLTPAFAKTHSRDRSPLYHFIEDRHWNAAGHELAATELVLHLDRRQWLPAPSGSR